MSIHTEFIGCSLGDVVAGKAAIVTGLQDEPDGALRVYIGARYKQIFVVIRPDTDEGQEAQRVLRQAWATGGHVLIPLPDPEAMNHG